MERLGELRREFEASQAQLKEANKALDEERAGRAKEAARAAKWKQRAFALSKQMLELSSVPPLRDEIDGVGARTDSRGRSARRQDDPETPLGGNSVMWSASANMDWKGGAGVGVKISGMDPPNMMRVWGRARKDDVIEAETATVPAHAAGSYAGKQEWLDDERRIGTHTQAEKVFVRREISTFFF